MKKVILTGLTAVMMSSAAMAAEVVEGTDTTVFTADSPALASEVNGNFAALIAAINDNSQRLDALESVVGDGSIAGTYTFIEMAVELAANSGSAQNEAYSEISTYKSTGSFTLEAGGNFSGTINENRSSLVDALHGVCDDGVFGCRFGFDPDFNNQAPVDSLGGTWTDDGSTVTLTLGPSDTVVLYKAGPKMLVFNGRDTVLGEGEPVYDFTNLVFLIKQ